MFIEEGVELFVSSVGILLGGNKRDDALLGGVVLRGRVTR